MPSRFQVNVSHEAMADWQELHEYIAENDSAERADHVSAKLQETIASLATFPLRGAYTKELLALGIRRYRESYFKPYRIIYSVDGSHVIVHLIVDGRRDMQTLLQKRMLR